MMAHAGVTIAIPNWNHEILLPRSIASALRAVDLLRNEGVPAEVLVIDDGSRDGSQTLLRQLEALYSKDGLRCLCFGVNAGSAASRNQTLNHARYRYLVFLDADNELIPENLPLFLDTLQQTQAAAAYGNLLIRTPTSNYAHYMHSCESIQKRIFRGGNYVDTFSVWDRAQLLDVGGYDASTHIVEDYELWLHLATNGRRIVFVPAVLGYYYLLPGSNASDRQKADIAESRVLRIFNQVKAREFLQMNTCHLRYHPELGYI
ncbi:MAG TPA: glycosyltransferase family A protein [Isosphaeraceae bacterium]|nr:glycosyltransferase family A protein [Isosphaeraceae bacterium]